MSGVSKNLVQVLRMEGLDADAANEANKRTQEETDELVLLAKEIGINVDIDVEDEIEEQFVERAKDPNCVFNAEELAWSSRVLDMAQVIHAMGVARLYICEPNTRQWKFTGLYGGLAIVTESTPQMQCAHFIRLIDLDAWNPNLAVIMEQELYENFKYHELKPWFHTFEMNDCMAGLSFTSEVEAKSFHEKVLYCCEHSSYDVIDEIMMQNERSYLVVGENYVRKQLVDGTELKWKKPGARGEIAKALGIDDEIEPVPEPEPEKPKGAVEEPHWGKGHGHAPAAAHKMPKTVEECSIRIECLKDQVKKLTEKKKHAEKGGQKEMSDSVQGEIATAQTEITLLKMEIEKLAALNPGSAKGNRKKNLVTSGLGFLKTKK